ncbi:hypothetical protein [Thermococcus sp.]|uniref:hypothetical protein n=1 Tax=Thermococcus sp. TaxID=35749 RepID=UPI00263734B5|nr:hypothetical protein [Thermococcus sp.]
MNGEEYWVTFVFELFWFFVIYSVLILIIGKLFIGDSWRQRVLLSTLPILSLEISLSGIAALYPPEDPDLILFGIVIAYILYRIFARFSWVPRLAGGVYVVFEALSPLLALSTFNDRDLFVPNLVLLGATLSLLELTRRRLLPRSKRGGS